MKFTRMILLSSIFLLVITAFLMRSPEIASAADESQQFRKGEVIVEVKPGASIKVINDRNRTTTIEQLFGTNFYRLNVPPDKTENKWIKRLERDPDVLSASLNPIVMSPTGVFARATVGFPDGKAIPGSNRQTYVSQPELINLLSLSDAHLRSRGGGVVVAVIDTGIDRKHPDLVSRLWSDMRQGGEAGNGEVDNDHDGLIDDAWGWDFVDNDNDPTEEGCDPSLCVGGHGTFIAGLIALIAPETRIMPIRAFSPDGMSNAFTVASAIKYATDHGARVINLSFGSPRNSSVVKQAIKYARQNGAILVAAMGNDNRDTDGDPEYPAVLKDVIGVAAIDSNSRKASFSNFGSRVVVDALGVKLTSTFPGVGVKGDYAMWSGTSFAAPLAASEAALILAEERRQNTRSIIEDTAIRIDDLNRDFKGKLGRGRIDPVAALDSLLTNRFPAGNYTSIRLIAGPDEVRADGRVGISVTDGEHELEIVTRALNVRTLYRFVVDGIEVEPGRLISDSFGGLAISFSTYPKSADGTDKMRLRLPGELYPVTTIRHVDLLDGDRVVLHGDFEPSDGSESIVKLIEKRTPLTATAVLAEARGKANVELKGKYEELRIEASGLLPGGSYRILVDGTDLGLVAAQSNTDKHAYLRIQLTNSSGANTLPISLQPVTYIRHVEIRDSSGQIILQGDFLT
jgi:thermitase